MHMPAPRTFASTAAAIALVVTLTACDSGDAAPTTTQTTTTQATTTPETTSAPVSTPEETTPVEEPLAADDPAPTPAQNIPVQPARVPEAAAPAPAPAPAPANTYFENCSAARAAGAAPVYAGDPGYGTHLDRDGDGVGCEK